MDELSVFIDKLKSICSKFEKDIPAEGARDIINELNNFLFTYKDNTYIDNSQENYYFSEYHKYWDKHYKEILNATIDDNKCEAVADALHDIYVRTGGRAFSEVYDTCNLNEEDICRIRLLTANQDFNGSREFKELADIYKRDKTIFDIDRIIDDPAGFIKNINITKLSQTDKRTKYAEQIGRFLKEYNSQPYTIIQAFNNDVYDFRQTLINYPSAGYGNKKADMFIRDMVVLNVWQNVTGFDKIDVASDVNTIKVALRTGILKTEIPLLSSFMDIFCYQYSYIEEMNAKAWRHVWEIWSQKYPRESISSPCLLDYFIYNVVGRQFCKPILCIFECEDKLHNFRWYNSRNKTCQVCYKNGNKCKKALLVDKVLPCLDDDGYIAIEQTAFVLSNIANPNLKECPFKDICEKENKNLQPPKSISIKGQTGWTSAYSKMGEGGGGLRA